jgi:hypothetical protein
MTEREAIAELKRRAYRNKVLEHEAIATELQDETVERKE